VEQMPAIQELGRNFGQWLGDLVKRLPEIIAKIKEFGSWVKNTVTGVRDFAGGWKNLAKILAGLAIAPTFISGLKTVFSLGDLVKTSMKAWPKILAKLGLAAGPTAGALLPIIGIVAGIAAAAFLIVKNWDKVKPVVINAVNGIRDTIGKAIESLSAWWGKHGEGVMAIIGKIADIITSVFIVAWNILSTAIEIAVKVLGGFIGFIADCVGWISEHKTVLGTVAIVVGTLTTALIAYNVSQAIANAGGLLAVIRMGAQAVATGALSAATGIWATVSSIAATATTAFGAAMAFLTSPITLVILAIGALIAAVYLIIKNWDKISEFFRGLWENIKNIFSGIGSWFSEKFTAAKDAIVNVFSGVIDWVKTNWQSIALFLINPFAGAFKYLYDNFEGFRNLVDNIVGAIKGIIGGLAGIFTGVFDAIQSKIIEFTDFFKSKFEGIKDFFGGIGNAIGGAFGGRDAAVPGHASGGIFTQPHIAQIAEQGAEAVVPLNNSHGGFDVWKQAGELGGYLKTASEQSPAISAAASVSAATPPVKTPEPSPVMAAASQKISSGDTAVRIDFKMTNNFNGGTPSSETTQQISEAGQKAGDDFEAKVKSVFEAMMRDRQRVSYT
jgi:phage-related protein